MKFCIIGLGIFGTNLARVLNRLGGEVLAVDRDPERVDFLKDEVAHALVLDSTDVRSLRQLPLSEMDSVIVAIGEDFESSMLTVAHLQEMGITRLVCRSINAIHGRLLELLQIPKIVLPEKMAAERMGRSLMLRQVEDAYALSSEYDIVEVAVPEHFVGQTLVNAALRNRYHLNLITVKQALTDKKATESHRVLGIVPPDYAFQTGDILVLFGKEQDVRRFLQD
jgi:trk system potassium uptake protein